MSRSLIVALVSLALLAATAASPAVASSASDLDAPLSFGDDTVGTFVGDGATLDSTVSLLDGLVFSDGAFAGFTEGYRHLGIHRNYTVRIVTDHPNWSALQAPVSYAAKRLSAATGASYAVGPTKSTPLADPWEIVVSFTSGNVCGAYAIGCAAWTATSNEKHPDDGQPIWRVLQADVWISPELTTNVLYETMLHELGHAAGLGHYDADFEGTHQVMRSYVDASDLHGNFQSGDFNGLSHSAATGFADGFFIDRPCLVDIADVRVSNSFCADITWMITTGVSIGYPDGTFRPSSGLSRQAMASFLYRLAGSPRVASDAPPFVDVPPGHAFYDAIVWMASVGLADGFPDGTFRPTDQLSRQALASFLHRLAGAPAPSTSAPTFSDVPPTHPFVTSIGWMAGAGVTQGYGDGTFRPDATLTRQALSAFLHRYDEL